MKLGEAVTKVNKKPGTETKEQKKNKPGDKENVVNADFERCKRR